MLEKKRREPENRTEPSDPHHKKAKSGKPEIGADPGDGGSRAAASSGSKRKVPKEAGHLYGEWTHKPSQVGSRPRCLHLFSGPELINLLAKAGRCVR